MKKIVLALAAMAAMVAAAAMEVPAPTGPVVDLAGVVDADTKAAMENEIRHMRGAATNPVQMAVLTVKTLDGETVEALAQRVFDKWELGDQGKDNGLLYLFALEEKKYRIHTGYGIEGLIPDGKAGQIGRLAVGDFRGGDYGAGIKKVVAGVHVTLNPSAAEAVYGRMPDTKPVATGEPAKDGGEVKEGTLGDMILGGFVFFGMIAFFIWRIIKWFLDPVPARGSGSSSSSSSSRDYSDSSWSSSSSSSSSGWSGGGGRSGGGGASGGW